jgi:hypothetical protein
MSVPALIPAACRASRRLGAVSILALSLALSGCSGGGAAADSNAPPTTNLPPSPPPPPAPPPPPPPPPAAFAPVVGQIFGSPLLTQDLFSTARGWQFDHPTNSGNSTNHQEADNATAAFDRASARYRLSIPLLGEGALFQTAASRSDTDFGGVVYSAALAPDAATAAQRTDLLVLRPGRPETTYDHVAWVSWFFDRDLGGDLHRDSYGVVGLAQPTPAAGMPTSGVRRYTGTILAHMSGNVGDFVMGTIEIEVDFAAGTLSGVHRFRHVCFMGCDYPTVLYPLSDISFARGATTFGGALSTSGAPASGIFSGRFAGPGAEELIISFRTPYFDPDFNRWTSVAGVALGRQR